LDPEILAALANAAPVLANPVFAPPMDALQLSPMEFSELKNAFYTCMPMPEVATRLPETLSPTKLMREESTDSTNTFRQTSQSHSSSPDTMTGPVKEESDDEYTQESFKRRPDASDILLQTPREVLQQRLVPSRKRKQKDEQVPKELVEKRQKNTEAARRSRLRKVLKMEHLSEQVSTLEHQLRTCQDDKLALQSTLNQYVARFGHL